MSDEIETFEDYWSKVHRAGRISLDETIEYAEDDGVESGNLVQEAASHAVEGSWVNYHFLSVIYHCDNGFYGSGHARFVNNREFEGNDSREMLLALAHAGFFNDVEAAIRRILEDREALGECMNLIGEHPIWDSGVTFEYDYERGLSDPEVHTYTLKCLGENEWQMFNPEGDSFEVISPSAMVGDTDNPERVFKLKLDNICAREFRERANE